jgi:hypothetical protein
MLMLESRNKKKENQITYEQDSEKTPRQHAQAEKYVVIHLVDPDRGAWCRFCTVDLVRCERRR